MNYRLKFEGVDTAISREAGEAPSHELLRLARSKWQDIGTRRVKRTTEGNLTTIELLGVDEPHRVKGIATNTANIPERMLLTPLRLNAPELQGSLTFTLIVITETGRQLHHYEEPGHQKPRRILIIDDDGHFYQHLEGAGREAVYAEIPRDEALLPFARRAAA
ncbi:MAG: hypothetical protein LC800_09735 [Acidobacteria bacterium]|nr:hypothetical protein [Acidobacteriota bacterium]